MTGGLNRAADRWSRCQVLDIPRYRDERGSLNVIEVGALIPFEIHRVYFHTGIPVGTVRAGHGHRRLSQFLVALTGSITVHVVASWGEEAYVLEASGSGLFLPPGVWRELEFVQSDSICLVAASAVYDPADYLSLEQLQSEWSGHL